MLNRLTTLDRRALPVALAGLAALGLLVPVQLASLILFDSIGLDRVVPPAGFMVVVPAAVLAALPTLLARGRYGRRTAIAIGGAALLALGATAASTIGFYGLCGPGC